MRIRISGIVQGVGFRPFIYRIASKNNLKGYVVNKGGAEVEIFVEGDDKDIESFLRSLEVEKPPPAFYEEVIVEEETPRGYRDFSILKSIHDKDIRSMIPPDIGVCHYCASEILESGTRFSGYYWNSCAWCGPRYSMMYRTPYDRENTSMARYKLCSDCERDYKDPENLRRFHAQGISCSRCGPRTYVYTSKGEKINIRESEIIDFISREILRGSIVAVKGVGGYHIAALASRDDVVLELRRRKRRPYKPFALMVRDLEVAEKIVFLNDRARELLQSPQKPILVLPKKRSSLVSEYVAPGLSSLGIMLPYTGFQILLMRSIPEGFLIMTSGNSHGRPMCTNLECVLRELSSIVDYIVEHDREIVHRVDDSVIRFTDGEPVFLRRSRGYAPTWIRTSLRIRDLVAVGAELQVAGAVGFDDKIIPTQFIGDLDDPGNLEDLERELKWLLETYDLRPEAVALDMHPGYHSRDIARKISREYNAKLVEVQHHHAHIASLMIEERYELDERAIGIAIDGTGYGVDGGIWGGEILIAGYREFKRVGSLRSFNLPGGDSSAIYPVKTLIALMTGLGYSWDEIHRILNRNRLIESLPHGVQEAEITHVLSSRGMGVKTSSMGRVLDAFSALLGVCSLRTYEGEPPIRLEAEADRAEKVLEEPYIRIFSSDGLLVVDIRDLLEWVLDKIEREERSSIALAILKSLGSSLARIAIDSMRGLRISRNEILVSGGAAVNSYIIRGIREIASEEDVMVRINRSVPPGDGGIGVGQIAVASALLEESS
ncbi:MAG: carbamoyltransferase HypF [Sulfolobales archaeon]